MKTSELLRLSLNGLRHSKLRAWLTIIGIVIGVAAVVSIIAIGQGMEKAILEQLSELGGDYIMIAPGGPAKGISNAEYIRNQYLQLTSTASELTKKELNVIKNIRGIKYISGDVTGRVDMSFSGKTAKITIEGVEPSIWKDITGVELEIGKYLNNNEEAVLGWKIAHELFDKDIVLNQQIKVNGKGLKVVGILEKIGGFGGIGTEDMTVYTSLEMGQELLGFEKDKYSYIIIRTENSDIVERVVNEVDSRLMMVRHVTDDNKDYTVMSSQNIMQTISQVMGIMTVFLSGIALISLVVGAVGIANTMFVSVIERTRQIGILKALGSTKRNIRNLFLLESGLLGLVGGIIGVALGSLISIGIGQASVSMMGGQTLIPFITFELLVGALIFSMIVGMVSGYFPAKRAAALQPVDALRYE